jgi:hypothetical protein
MNCAWGKLLNCTNRAQKIVKFFNCCINFINFAPLHVLRLGRVPHLPHPCYGSGPIRKKLLNSCQVFARTERGEKGHGNT